VHSERRRGKIAGAWMDTPVTQHSRHRPKLSARPPNAPRTINECENISLFRLVLTGSFIVTTSYGLPAPSTSFPTRKARHCASRLLVVSRPAPRVVPEVTVLSTTVVIDAGHGGFDRGGIPGQRVPEKPCSGCRPGLKRSSAYGYRVVMTRDSDVFIPSGRGCDRHS